ncbi:hypothetical protein EDB66_4553 [Vibrio crassostreae]|nr:hypothetical protein EDB66_4553 [Vibrio crassostreae]
MIFQYQKEKLDLSKPIEKWLYDFVLHQLDYIDSQMLKKKYGFSRKEAKRKFKNAFKENKSDYLLNVQLNDELVNILNEASGFIKMEPMFTVDEIFNSLIDTVKAHDLVEDTNKLITQKNNIILCLLVLMHKRSFHIKQNVIGHSHLNFPTYHFDFKPLELQGTVEIPDGPNIGFTLVQTELEMADCCQEDLLKIDIVGKNNFELKQFDSDADITVFSSDTGIMMGRLD